MKSSTGKVVGALLALMSCAGGVQEVKAAQYTNVAVDNKLCPSGEASDNPRFCEDPIPACTSLSEAWWPSAPVVRTNDDGEEYETARWRLGITNNGSEACR